MNNPILLFCASLFIISCTAETSFENEAQEEHLQQEEISVDTTNTVNTPDTVDISQYNIAGLPCPNSSTHAGGPWTYEEAEARKDDIYDMALTSKYFSWKNPTSGGAIHINKNDEIEVYQFTFGIFRGTDSQMVDFVPESKDTFVVMTAQEARRNVQGMGFGNESSVLITSEIDVKESKSFPEILEELFHPGNQIYYLKQK